MFSDAISRSKFAVVMFVAVFKFISCIFVI